MKNKYGNKKTGKYDSKREASHAIYLHAMQKAGNISELREQVRFELIPSQYIDGECVERSLTYIADFTFYDAAGKYRTQDCKGFQTEVFRIKKKLMLYLNNIIVECV